MTYDEFERRYFPRAVRERELENETPTEAGRRIAREILENIKFNKESV